MIIVNASLVLRLSAGRFLLPRCLREVWERAGVLGESLPLTSHITVESAELSKAGLR